MKPEHYNPLDQSKNILMEWIDAPACPDEPEFVAQAGALLSLFVAMHRIICLADSLSDEGCEDVIYSIKSEIEEFISSHSPKI
jgi:hypothetical protein